MLNLDWHFFPVFNRLDPATAYPGTYNFGLVATSVAIAILAAFVAFSISGRIAAATTRWARYAWASAGAISMGGGIWSMHFVGMLAFSLPSGRDGLVDDSRDDGQRHCVGRDQHPGQPGLEPAISQCAPDGGRNRRDALLGNGRDASGGAAPI
jgi:Bacterial signalling protein N terminal repeat